MSWISTVINMSQINGMITTFQSLENCTSLVTVCLWVFICWESTLLLEWRTLSNSHSPSTKRGLFNIRCNDSSQKAICQGSLCGCVCINLILNIPVSYHESVFSYLVVQHMSEIPLSCYEGSLVIIFKMAKDLIRWKLSKLNYLKHTHTTVIDSTIPLNFSSLVKSPRKIRHPRFWCNLNLETEGSNRFSGVILRFIPKLLGSYETHCKSIIIVKTPSRTLLVGWGSGCFGRGGFLIKILL